MSAKKVIIISTIIIIIAAVIVFFVFLNKQKPDPVSAQCAFACQSGQKTAFCDVELTLNDKTLATCYNLSTNSQYSSYNVQACPSISCTLSAQQAAHLADQTCITGLGGAWQTPINGMCPQTKITAVIQLTPSDQSPIAGQICCR
ncbi:MAG: hypothetical protein ABSG05_01030 [Candidatus Pacearchaeota archaeon]|jgi:hypothetical protein